MTIDRPERETQNRIVTLFKNELGYRYLGDRTDFANSNIWEGNWSRHGRPRRG